MVNRTEVEVKLAESVVVQPGDTLVIRTSDRLEQEEAERIIAAIRDKLPGVEVLLIALDGEMAVHRPSTIQQAGK
ncbi:hypothetical protein ABZ777_32460 [Micromonospora parva]|uniref:hypothetical protein n=1 Tax=Micromonospora parva TaxID=1464048 RepID=UPI0033C7F346